MAKSVVIQLTHFSVFNEDIQSSIFSSYIIIIKLFKKKKDMNDCCPRAMQLTCSLHKVSLNFKN